MTLLQKESRLVGDSSGIAVVLSIHSLPFFQNNCLRIGQHFYTAQPFPSYFAQGGIFPSQISIGVIAGAEAMPPLDPWIWEAVGCALLSPSSCPCKGNSPILGYAGITASKLRGIQYICIDKGSCRLKQCGSARRETAWTMMHVLHESCFHVPVAFLKSLSQQCLHSGLQFPGNREHQTPKRWVI